MKYRLFYIRHWLTPSMQEKVRKERSESPDATPEIRYKRKKVVEVKSFDDEAELMDWVKSNEQHMVGHPDVLDQFVDLWAYIANPGESNTQKMEVDFMASEQELPLT